MPTELAEKISKDEAHRRGVRYLIALGAAAAVSTGIDILELSHQVPSNVFAASVAGEVVALVGMSWALNRRNDQNLESRAE